MLSISVMQPAALANFDPAARRHPGTDWALILYFNFLCAWLIHIYRQFRKP